MADAPLLPPAIEPAELVWHDGVPESVRFGDIYFSRDNGLEEARYVFIGQNRLPERFQSVPEAGSFVVAESGFGTGLNFLATSLVWLQQAPDNHSTLHFISAERFPLTREDLTRALSLWPDLQPLAGELINQYPPLTRGAHRLVLAGGRIRLTLYFGDVAEAWAQLGFHADAWFLDGFAPSRNPGMWSEQTIGQIRAHSKPGTTLATFTAVGQVRRALATTGFQMWKAPGYGRKRDMLAGRLPFDAPLPETSPPGREPAPVAVLGAGIAGCLLARNLAERGWPVVLIDAASGPGRAASGNRQGATYVKLAVDHGPQSELALSALTFCQRHYRPYRDQYWHPTGLLQLAWSDKEADRQNRFLARNRYPEDILQPVSRAEAERLTGVALPSGGLWFPGGGWLQPGELCETLSHHPRITRLFDFTVQEITPDAGLWRIDGGDQQEAIRVQHLVICAGHLTPNLLPEPGEFRFKAIRGQVTHLPQASLSTPPAAVICGSRYLNPGRNGVSVTGATFDLHSDQPEPLAASNVENLRELARMLPGILVAEAGSALSEEAGQGRVGFRCTTHDYQPVAGPLQSSQGETVAGVYLLTGLGSKGLTYAPLLAELVADQVTGQPAPLPHRVRKLLATGRMHRHQPHPGSKI
ncbi:MAG TPA: bifunctional tRNA (5-methylaminomethyl-2-thiouridine)(34)-methyltransferase MnmD/FAD-dependent 5-carboxymethylaminomethyl-2-thiouridine(34) oxidoreductase MnmC [Marinobacter sp.]|uniref:bifunctional tRNA (5-methylaminomethyl-2-thiouridine)(34)-methyltransferase MnmD/FAD-dependent 5-carboxymethylaminomethyl-2-thiouridine(34) oxidoreductase MnmC n=1 Tax=Marinobacter sp. TaxID=50741 RepID=UPI002D7EF6A2|nr:bifunctional tRNA (5-methylaminomethyl-2-thiouridine)(34)-methyltransferase MnmD/FAD-dependent 5-carboxymethylaminomethyl-2-thiouridine(34) oxidoreductase MnmC [Marinobacter sp.]HET8801908.1 bifunctional tRNA (5-methylaminomethyl-2-thiouridine)(34)-methyltransferase MnmD/FAD-dependent 5-carboxymethylaminomethyl-2-thiouridine(34) oxidoreductase MnmC [Marinobacter sp.]